MPPKKSDSKLIKLPELKSISVSNYPLFKANWSYDLKPGANLFRGINGIGKTTATNLVIYGIVGYGYGLDENYFNERISEENEDEDLPNAVLKLSFLVGTHEFIVEREIIQNSISKITIDNEVYDSDTYDNLDEFYEGQLREYTGIGSLSDIGFLLQYFLIRVEEGNYLLWGDKGGDQAKLTRLLINQKGFEEEYQVLARNVKDADTKHRQTQNFRAQIVKRRDTLEKERQHALSQKDGFKDEAKLLQEFKSKNENLEEIKKIREKSLIQAQTTKEKIDELYLDLNNTSLEIEQKGELTVALENSLYEYIYADDKVLSAIHKLKNYNRCIFCDSTPEYDIQKLIVSSVEKDCKCPVCQTSIKGGKRADLNDKEEIAKLETIKKELSRLKEKRAKLSDQLDKQQEILDEQMKRERELSVQAHGLAVELFDLEIQVRNFAKNPLEKVTGFDSQIHTLNGEIGNYDKQIEPLKIAWESALEELEKKNKIQEKTLKSFEDDLNQIFQKYAKLYFNDDCKLVTTNMKPKDSNVSLESFVPKLNGRVRWSENQCSTSERIFLEYLFRISLLELYSSKSGNLGFLILETSEGAFDYSNTKQLAKAFTKFGENNIPFVIVSNFSKRDFLKTLAHKLGSNKKKRVLNFIHFGHLTKNQTLDLQSHKQMMINLGLE